MVAIFRSGNETHRYYYALRKEGVPCRIISTPINVARSCGISVSFNARDAAIAEKLLRTGKYYSFIRFYNV